MIVYLARDNPPFVMYCVNRKPRSSLLIESVDSMIRIGYCILVFTILPGCGVCGWNNDKGLCSKFVHINCVDRVVDGPHGCTSKDL